MHEVGAQSGQPDRTYSHVVQNGDLWNPHVLKTLRTETMEIPPQHAIKRFRQKEKRPIQYNEIFIAVLANHLLQLKLSTYNLLQ